MLNIVLYVHKISLEQLSVNVKSRQLLSDKIVEVLYDAPCETT